MIKIENVEVNGWESAIRGMRNPLNSWDRSDTVFSLELRRESNHARVYAELGEADLDLMRRLARAGSDHAKYRRMITVYADIVAPLYWWKEYDTYKVGTVANSCSTMHKIQAKEFTLDDFSHDYIELDFNMELLDTIVHCLNVNRERYLETKNKLYWWQMIQLLPSSYNQRRTVQLNYEVLANMYKSRRLHKLDEWREFSRWIERLPYSEVITCERD